MDTENGPHEEDPQPGAPAPGSIPPPSGPQSGSASEWSMPPAPVRQEQPAQPAFDVAPAVGMQPIPFNQSLDIAMKVYKKGFLKLVALAAMLVTPLIIFQIVIQAAAVDTISLDGQTFYLTRGDQSRALMMTWVFIGVSYFLVTPLLTAAMIRAISDVYLGEEGTIWSALSFGLRRALPVLWVTVLGAVMTGAILVATILVAVQGAESGSIGAFGWLIFAAVIVTFFLYIRFLFAPAVVVVENIRGFKALGRSWTLVSGAWWKCFGILMCTGIFIGLIQFLALLPVAAVSGGSGTLAVQVADGAVSVLVAPITVVVIVLLYFDSQIRKEGLDLRYMAQRIRSQST